MSEKRDKAIRAAEAYYASLDYPDETWTIEGIVDAALAVNEPDPDDEWEYGWSTTNGTLGGWGMTSEQASDAVREWNKRAARLASEANGRASYPGAFLLRRTPGRKAGPWLRRRQGGEWVEL